MGQGDAIIIRHVIREIAGPEKEPAGYLREQLDILAAIMLIDMDVIGEAKNDHCNDIML